jgi:extracellular matrix regulatory protein B
VLPTKGGKSPKWTFTNSFRAGASNLYCSAFQLKGGIFVFLHLGENIVVPIKDVIGIFDMETAADSTDTIQFLRMAEEDGFVQRITSEKPKSFIIAEVNKKSKIFLSPISSATLGKRTESVYDEA